MTASVSLIKAIGGGWNVRDLPVVQKDSPQMTHGQ
jgi:hypothetical protein